MGGCEAMSAAGSLFRWHFVVPSAKIGTRRGQAGAQTPRFEQAVVIDGQEHGLRLLELRLSETGRELDISVAEFAQGWGRCNLGRE
jgi:hypothetical protein